MKTRVFRNKSSFMRVSVNTPDIVLGFPNCMQAHVCEHTSPCINMHVHTNTQEHVQCTDKHTGAKPHKPTSKHSRQGARDDGDSRGKRQGTRQLQRWL
jgi:hypothetical protein